MNDDPYSPFHPTKKAGKSTLGRAMYQLETSTPARDHGGPVNVELGPFGKKFVGFGLILFGVWIAPDGHSSGGAWLIPGLSLALGAYGLIAGIIQSWGSGWHPFLNRPGLHGFVLRIVWACRPRIWMLLWLMIIAVFIGHGSPHLRIQYGPSGCDYFGLNGWESYGVGGSCPLIRAFPIVR